MKKIRALSLILIVLGSTIPSSGCWNYKELNDLSIVSGVAIDKSSDGMQYVMTVEIIDLRGGGRETKVQSKRVEAEGKTLFDAARNVIKVSSKKLYWTHAEVFIISQDVAKEGVLPIVDYITRGSDRRLTIHILISREKTAKEFLSQQSVTTDIRAFEMEKMIETDKRSLSKVPHVDVRNFINALTGEGISATLPTVSIISNDGVPTSEVSGTALFSKDKLVGFLDEEDTKYLLFVKNQIKGGALPLSGDSVDLHDGITLEIYKNETKVKPVYVNGRLVMNVDIDTEVSLEELEASNNLIDEKGRGILKENAERTLKSNILNVIHKVKKEFKVDIFGFGSAVQREMPELWKSMAADWNKTFRDLDVSVNVNINVRSSGLALKPIQIGD